MPRPVLSAPVVHSRTAWVVAAALVWLSDGCRAQEFRPIPLRSEITQVQPMTGIVLWATNGRVADAPIQLEFAYLGYAQVVTGPGEYDWKVVDDLLAEVASRRHQAILRWYDTYVGQDSQVPQHIRRLPDYRETRAQSEGRPTTFPDWSHHELQRSTLNFFEKFAERYDNDSRLAFVEVGFGLWSEYHIYDGPMKLGQTFPSLEYQARFARHLATVFETTPWMISVDAADDHAPYAGSPELLVLPFGVFDDSFNHARHAEVNEPNWIALGNQRWQRAPTGGEFSFFEKKDQSQALSPDGPHGIPFEQHAARFHISFIIGDGQVRYQKPERVREAGQACGYRFRVTSFAASPDASRVEIENTGIAPIYYDAFPCINGVRSKTSLRGLLPGDRRQFEVKSGGATPQLTIECDRLVPGQRIEFEADLP